MAGKVMKRPAWMHCLLFLMLLGCIAAAIVAAYFGTKAKEDEKKEEDIIVAKPRDFSNDTVIIIGAGLAGLSAARDLNENGVKNIIILEADTRVGGRMKSVDFAGTTINTGASWIAGIKDNPVWREAQDLILKGFITDESEFMVKNEAGEDQTKEMSDLYNKTFKDVIVKLSQKLDMGAGKDMENADQSARSALNAIGWHPKSALEYLWEVKKFDLNSGLWPRVLSVKYGKPDKLIAMDPRKYLITDPRGLQAIPESMTKTLLEDKKVLHLNQTVVEIKHGSNSVQIKTKGNRTFEGHYVISTLPLGVLQKDLVTFDPPLPPKKLDAIHKHAVAHYVNIFLAFNASDIFWPTTMPLMYASTTRGKYPLMENVKVPSSSPYRILKLSVTSMEALRLSEMTEDDILDELMDIFTKIFSSKKINNPEKIYVEDWDTNPFSRGGYSTWPFGMTMKDFEMFNSPIGRLYFAGEAHSRSHGYLQGAMLSGQKSAHELMKCMKLSSNCNWQ